MTRAARTLPRISARWCLDTDPARPARGSEDAHRTHADYDPQFAAYAVSEAANILLELGAAAAHVGLFGGLVPGLLVPQLDPGQPPHIGTRDVDLCLSAAIVHGDTAEYERIEKCLRRAGFDRTEESWALARRRGRLGLARVLLPSPTGSCRLVPLRTSTRRC